jgi:hypothetical protein
MGASTIATGTRTGLRKQSPLTRSEILLTGAVGAFAPQILRWYNQADLDMGFDVWAAAGHAAVVALFLTLAGYITMVWGVRTLKEAFFVGLAVPAIILGPGTDLAKLAQPASAAAQVRSPASRVSAVAHPALGAIDLRVRGDDGSAIPRFHTVASDGRARSYSAENGYLPLPAGRYRVVVSAAGYETAAQDVVVAPSQNAPVYVTLHRLSAAQRFLHGANRAVGR